MQADGTIVELVLLDELPAARIHCPPGIVPTPGQYLMAHVDGSDAPLATVLFAAKVLVDPSHPKVGGFFAAPPVPAPWTPGMLLHLRGPLGHGFSLPASARRIALIALDTPDAPVRTPPRRLLSLLDLAFKQGASVTLVCGDAPEDLPLQVEVQPMRALMEVCTWADYVACDSTRDSWLQFKVQLRKRVGFSQVLIGAPMPCGGLAECGVCSVDVRGGPDLACERGPVFDLGQLMR